VFRFGLLSHRICQEALGELNLGQQSLRSRSRSRRGQSVVNGGVSWVLSVLTNRNNH
jgi:hypothetical protein